MDSFFDWSAKRSPSSLVGVITLDQYQPNRQKTMDIPRDNEDGGIIEGEARESVLEVFDGLLP